MYACLLLPSCPSEAFVPHPSLARRRAPLPWQVSRAALEKRGPELGAVQAAAVTSGEGGGGGATSPASELGEGVVDPTAAVQAVLSQVPAALRFWSLGMKVLVFFRRPFFTSEEMRARCMQEAHQK